MPTDIRFLGVAGYEIISPGARVLIDPFLTGNPSAPVGPADLDPPDLILVSHGSFDHFGDAAEIALRSGAPVVCGADVKAAMVEHGVPERQVRATIWGIVIQVGNTIVRPVECHHWSSVKLASGAIVTGTPLAFIVEPEAGVRIYHYGDTSIFDMRLLGELYQPTVAIIGCTQPWELIEEGAGKVMTGELSPAEAARVAEMLGAPLVLASHYLEVDAEVEEFLSLVAQLDSGSIQALAPAPGETIALEAAAPATRV